jgi:hypothetical protein
MAPTSRPSKQAGAAVPIWKRWWTCGGQRQERHQSVFAGSVPYLKLAGMVLGGWQMARAA